MAYDPEHDPENRDPLKTDSSAANQDASGRAVESGAREALPARAAGNSAKPAPERRAASKSRPAYDDEDYDDEDEDDEDEDEEEERERRRAAARRARAKRRGARTAKRKLNVPKTEQDLDIPKKQTIGMLGSVSALMIIMWFAAKLACNAHPDHLRPERYVSVDQLARDPKNAGLEFQLRLMSKDYLLAGEIASGKMADKIHELLMFCESNMDTCEKQRLELKGKVTATAALIDTTPTHAVVEVTTYVNGENPKTVTLDVAPFGKVWKVTQSRDGGSVAPAQAVGTAANAPPLDTSAPAPSATEH